MGVFPKRKRKYAPGGIVPPASGLLGIGVQYIPTAADIPNLEALKLLDDRRRLADEKHEAEIAKRTPNEQAINDLILKAPGSSGQKAKMNSEVITAIKDYEDRTRKNPDWVFTDEGKQALRGIEDIINPSKFQAMGDNYRNLTSAYQTAEKNQALNQYHFINGKVSVIDTEDGTSKLIDPNLLKGESAKRYKPLTFAEKYQEIYDSQDGSLESLNYGLRNAQDVQTGFLSRFFDAVGSQGGSDGFTAWVSNSNNLKHAKQQALNGLTTQERDSLKADYVRKTGGTYSDAGFDGYLNNMVDEQVAKMRQSSSKTDRLAIEQYKAQLKAAGKEESGAGQGPTFNAVNDSLVVDDSEGIDEQAEVMRFGVSMIPADDQSVVNVNLNGNVYSFGGESDESNYSAENNKGFGMPYKSNKVIPNAVKISSSIFPITTGRVLLRSASTLTPGSFESKQMILKGSDFEYGGHSIPTTSQIETVNYTDKSGRVQSFKGIKDSKGNYIEVQLFSGDVYKVDDDGTTRTIVKPHDPNESIRTMGVNMSMMGYTANYLTDDASINDEGANMLVQIGQAYGADALNEIEAKFLAAKKKSPLQAKQYLNWVLNNFRQSIETGQNFTTLSYGKSEHTKKDQADQVR